MKEPLVDVLVLDEDDDLPNLDLFLPPKAGESTHEPVKPKTTRKKKEEPPKVNERKESPKVRIEKYKTVIGAINELQSELNIDSDSVLHGHLESLKKVFIGKAKDIAGEYFGL